MIYWILQVDGHNERCFASAIWLKTDYKWVSERKESRKKCRFLFWILDSVLNEWKHGNFKEKWDSGKYFHDKEKCKYSRRSFFHYLLKPIVKELWRIDDSDLYSFFLEVKFIEYGKLPSYNWSSL